MLKAILFAVVSIFVGMIAFALLSPLLFQGADFKKLGKAAAPIIFIVCGGAGFFYGLRRSKKQ